MKTILVPSTAIRLAMLGICLMTAACTTPTQRSADIIGKRPHPSPINNFQVVIPGRIYRSGQPKDEADWKYLNSIGITSVVKLNKFSSDENEAIELCLAKKYGIKVIPVYMPPEDFPHNWNPLARPDEKDLLRAVMELENKSNGKVLVHCSHGKDRTGLVVAVYSVRNKNYCKDAAYAEMKSYGANPLLLRMKSALDDPHIKEHPGCNRSARR